MAKNLLLAGNALTLLLGAATPALAQQSLEDRVRGLEELLGVPQRQGDNRTLEQRVMDLEALVRAQRGAAMTPPPSQAAPLPAQPSAPPPPVQAAAKAPVPEPAPAPVSEPAPSVVQIVQENKERLDRIEMRVDQNIEADAMRATRLSTLEQQFSDTSWTFDNDRPTIGSGDGRFSMTMRGRFQVDTAFFNQDDNINATNAQVKDLASGGVVRRFYVGAEGRAFRDFWYEYRMDLGGANAEGSSGIINIARVAYNIGNFGNISEPHLRINAGVIQPLFTYGDGVSSASITFMERAGVINTAIFGYGADARRRGFELTFQQANIFRPGDNLVISSAFTGATSTPAGGLPTNTTDEGTQLVGRSAYRLWSDGFSNLQTGMSWAHILNVTGNAVPGGPRTIALQDRPEIRVDGTRLVSTLGSTNLGTSILPANLPMRGGDLIGFEGGGNYRNFFLYGEYMNFGVDRDVNCTGCTPSGGIAGVNPGDPRFKGWYVEGTWILTGETKTYQVNATNREMGTFVNPRVITPFDPSSGNWGALELAMRYSTLDLNWREGMAGQTLAQAPVGGVRGGEQNIWTFGLNWYPNNVVTMRFNYLIADVNRLGFIGTGATASLQQIGQKFQAFGMRLQFSN
jgi:phosphate-selective porin OprO and OprP